MKRKKELQGGVYNFLGKQKTVNAPIKWKSSAKHPVAFLAYITKEEMDILIQKNIYGSLKGKPNKGPFGLPSLQGSGSGSEGAGTGDTGGMSSSESASQAGYGNDAQGEFGGTSTGGAEGLGLGQQDTFASDVDESNVMSVSDEEEEEGPKTARSKPMGIAAYNMSLMNPEKTFSEKAMNFAMSPIGTTLATAYDSFARGPVTPGYESFDQDYGKNVQVMSGPSTNLGGGSEEKLPKIEKSETDYLTSGSGYKPHSFYVKDTLSGGLRSLN